MTETNHDVAAALSPGERAVLRFVAESGGDEYAYGFSTIGSDTGLERNVVRAACRALAEKGLLRFHRSLFNDDGQTAGAGYGCTRQGLHLFWNTNWKALDAPAQAAE